MVARIVEVVNALPVGLGATDPSLLTVKVPLATERTSSSSAAPMPSKLPAARITLTMSRSEPAGMPGLAPGASAQPAAGVAAVVKVAAPPLTRLNRAWFRPAVGLVEPLDGTQLLIVVVRAVFVAPA